MHIDWTISIGNIVTVFSFLALSLVAWRDFDWRVRNLEVWRKEHMVDADARDEIIKRMDKILYHVTGGREGSLGNEVWMGQERQRK